MTQPAHTITLLKPLVIVNLLPYELIWEMKQIDCCGIIKPGKETSVHTVDVSAGFQISFRIENFVSSGDLIVGMPPHDFYTRIRLYDNANRLLLLKVFIAIINHLRRSSTWKCVSIVTSTGQNQLAGRRIGEVVRCCFLLDCE